ncbi:unnamed protein product [Caenorhabditis angaria]|uniref:WD_REPEATS_REGION domain-containing protein n=1 Tax=Caenorhabditis angaria TaxID=860376 RepID=A0A9P1MYN8_9PELO|nr:unnamed protein product [Caenorhabditis angaria]
MPSAIVDRQFNMNTSWRPPPYNEIIPDRNDEINEWTTSASRRHPKRPDPNADGAYEGGPMNMRGYLYYPKTKKYFKMTNELSGIRNGASFNANSVQERRNQQRDEKFATNRPRFISGSFIQRPVIKPMHSLMAGLELGGSRIPQIQRQIDEMRLLNHTPRPSFVLKNPIKESGDVIGCEFLEVNEEGNRIIGSFPIGDPYSGMSKRQYSSVYVFNVDTNEKLADEECRKKSRGDCNSNGYNTMGLVIQPVNTQRINHNNRNYAAFQFEDFIVDQTLAKIDKDVTCLLTVTAQDIMDPITNAVTSQSNFHANPLVDISNPNCLFSTLSKSCPIYNTRWRNTGQIWSLGFNEKMMGVSFGLEDHFRIHDIVADKGFNGNLVIMGLRSDDLIRSDLRLRSHHITGSLRGTRSTSFVKMLKTAHPDCFVAEGFDNRAGLWDLRFTNRPLLSFKGHRNQHYRMSCFVDPKERFFFAVGDDGVTRGWSLMSGDMLCSIRSPRPETFQQIDFPRLLLLLLVTRFVYINWICKNKNNKFSSQILYSTGNQINKK